MKVSARPEHGRIQRALTNNLTLKINYRKELNTVMMINYYLGTPSKMTYSTISATHRDNITYLGCASVEFLNKILIKNENKIEPTKMKNIPTFQNDSGT